MLVHKEDLCRSSREFRALFRNHCTIECERDELGEFGDMNEMPSPPKPMNVTEWKKENQMTQHKHMLHAQQIFL